MKPSRIKPIGYVKANAAELINELQETLALLRIIALGNRDIAAGKTIASGEVFRRLRASRRKR